MRMSRGLKASGLSASARDLAEMTRADARNMGTPARAGHRSEEHTSELQSQSNLVCRLLLEKKKRTNFSTLSVNTCSCPETRAIGPCLCHGTADRRQSSSSFRNATLTPASSNLVYETLVYA